MVILPNSRPQWTLDRLKSELAKRKVSARTPVFVVGVRGYYRDSMGDAGKNDIAMYDDAFFVVSPRGMWSFNGNTDPSVSKTAVATLKTGIWRYKKGFHGVTFHRPGYPYPAFVQGEEVAVTRYGRKGDFVGYFGINIHRGGTSKTSSLGCQTLPPEQWGGFYSRICEELKASGRTDFDYVLIEGQG